MTVYLVILLTVLTHTAFKGSKVAISLYAIEFGATPFEIGILFSMYSVFPVLLSVYAGKMSDRMGFRLPMLFGAGGLMLALLLPFLFPRLGSLYASAVLIGMCYIFYTVSIQHLIGALAEGHERTRNYSLYSIGVALTAMLGPTTAGFAIDLIGHRHTYLLLAILPGLPFLALLVFRSMFPHVAVKQEERHTHRVMDLVRDPPLRRAFVTAGLVETGLELFNFFLPIYGHYSGLTASQIGICMGAFAAALLLVRGIMPMLSRRSSEEAVLSGSLFLAAVTALLFPLVSTFALLALVSFVLGLGLGCGSPLSMILAYNRAPEGRAGEAVGLRQTVNKATEVLMPLIFGSLSTALGMPPVFWMEALILGWAGELMRRDARRKIRAISAPPTVSSRLP
ncbi:MAG TPA: MFS transporter [Burkholderiales bacterium]|nr:MFS transporter [Burkholderiales bacterium]